MRKTACGNPHCAASSGIHDGLTFGSGELDFNGFWQYPCAPCARAHERHHPEADPCWPFATHPEEHACPVATKK